MKKALLLLTILVVSAITLSTLAVYVLLQTSYAPKAVSALVEKLTPYQLKLAQVHYQPPLQISLTDAELVDGDKHIPLAKLTFWLSQVPWQNGKIAFDSILIEQASIELEQLTPTLFDNITLHQLALKHVDINAGNWSAREVNMQVENPLWQTDSQTLPYGDIQLSAEQLYVRGEALDKLLVDMRYQPSDSTIFGSSFDWRGAKISGQAEQYPQGWSLINVTIDQLALAESSQIEQLTTTLEQLNLPIYHINSLDILGSSFNYGQWRFEQLDASIEDLYLEQSVWNQQSGYASFNAESIRNPHLELFSPRAKLGLNKDGIRLDEFDTDFKQGRVQMQGQFSPQTVHLEKLKLSSIKWLEQTEQIIPSLTTLSSSLKKLTIEQLEVENTQLIQIEKQPYWQVSGLNVEGSQLTLIDKDKFGLLDGSIEVSANAANLDKLLSTQAHLIAHTKDGQFNLDRAFIPLEQGYIEASGTWQRESLSAPWQLTLHADGLPLAHYLLDQYLPFSLSGLAEVDLELSGLSGDYSMLAHSLSGRVTTHLHQTDIVANSIDGAKEYQQELKLGEIALRADRGRVTINSSNTETQVAGEMDLTKPQFATLLLKSEQECSELWSDILNRANVIKQTCDAPASAQTPSDHSPEGSSTPNTDL
ncbi:AsmA family protein [Vibrio sp. M260118]|uniref:AsmA family protein n=1 Tax=Vibrio sp. M260118 TaxID=3020896 RepID=UPI002F413366